MSVLDGIHRVGVIGAGQMGRGIAQLAASQGFAVTLADMGRDIAERGRATVGKQLDKLVEKNKLAATERAQMLARIEPCDLYGKELESVDFVVEAATEDVVVKREISPRSIAPAAATSFSRPTPRRSASPPSARP